MLKKESDTALSLSPNTHTGFGSEARGGAPVQSLTGDFGSVAAVIAAVAIAAAGPSVGAP